MDRIVETVVKEMLGFCEQCKDSLVAMTDFVNSYEARSQQLQANPKEIEVSWSNLV